MRIVARPGAPAPGDGRDPDRRRVLEQAGPDPTRTRRREHDEAARFEAVETGTRAA